MTKNVIEFIILNNQMFRINDIDIIQHKSVFSCIALIAVIMWSLIIVRNYYLTNQDDYSFTLRAFACAYLSMSL